jgi:hypothetical protein
LAVSGSKESVKLNTKITPRKKDEEIMQNNPNLGNHVIRINCVKIKGKEDNVKNEYENKDRNYIKEIKITVSWNVKS